MGSKCRGIPRGNPLDKERDLKYLIVFFCGLLAACSSYTRQDIEGLWQLEEVEIDAMRKAVSPTFIEINPNRSFAVSRETGDLAGVYRLSSKQLSFYSQDQSWFNTTWRLYKYKDFLDLKGRDEKNRYARLRFRKIDKIPDFQEFENKILGKWQLYKIKKASEIQNLTDTWFIIDSDGNYLIEDTSGPREEGRAFINTRHKKIVFEKDSVQWAAWFYGKELRLNNDKLGVEYSLRKKQ